MKAFKPLIYIAAFVVPFILVWVSFMAHPLAGLIVTAILLTALYIWQRPALLTLRGQRQYAQGNNNRALEILKKAHEVSGRRPLNSVTYAYILLRCGDDKESAKVLNYVLLNSKLKPEHKNAARQNLSLVRYRQGDYAEALRIMEDVFADYKTSSVYGSLGYYKILLNAPDAMEFALEAYDFNGDDKIIIDNLIQLYIADGEFAKAKELSDKSLAAGNKSVEIYYHAGQVALGLGDSAAAREMFENARSCTRSFMTTVPEEEVETALLNLNS
jgi:predicted Zn-dependent protease